ncbi:peptidoglycan D,D-transpeptidase FtsI family protein [Dermatobacter hominis]|uniref:peptidoglycan D,D-transpeptidase FtsI family protein n=1 Tax=Dermatobacter hominis TaxID=2884263 RepID=UPI001D1267B0|nr:penicillin-binding protein 2 [Dermatobacter hominis]UDY35972.1 penicillin-binding protein 2 [Dermatobacter hominis]
MVGAFGVLALLPLVKLVGVQFTDASALAAEGLEQRQRTETIPAQRGSILDRNGTELAMSVPRTTVAVSKVRLAEAGIGDDAMLREFGTRLATLLRVDPAPVVEAITSAAPDAKWVMVDRYADEQVARKAAQALAAQDMDGVLMLDPASERVHPGGESGVRVIGTVGPDGPGPRAGVEAAYDDVLEGTPGKQVVERGSQGETITDGSRVIEAPQPGEDVQVTLDRTLQYETEQILSKGSANARAAGGIAIVGRPSTGELLAVAGVERDEETGEMHLSTRPLALSNAYQAGSVFKLVTTAAAYEAGVIDDHSTFSVGPTIRVYDREFSDNEVHPVETMNVDQIVAESSNVGTIQIAQRLGAEKLHQALVDFGFGQVSALGHPAESAGLLPDVDSWTPPDTAAASIGSFQSTTVLQLWSAFNVIANQGIYVPPRLVEGTIGPDGRLDPARAADTRRVVSATTAARVSRALQAVVQAGTGKQWSLPGYPVAAKTGTGRMPSPEKVDDEDAYIWPDGTYHHVTTFAGYLPADRPQVSITVMLFDTAQGLTGSTSAGPVFSDLARLSIRELSIAPTADPAATTAAGSTDDDGLVRSVPAGETAAATDRALVPTTTAPSRSGSTGTTKGGAATAKGGGTGKGTGSTGGTGSGASTRSGATSTTIASSGRSTAAGTG